MFKIKYRTFAPFNARQIPIGSSIIHDRYQIILKMSPQINVTATPDKNLPNRWFIFNRNRKLLFRHDLLAHSLWPLRKSLRTESADMIFQTHWTIGRVTGLSSCTRAYFCGDLFPQLRDARAARDSSPSARPPIVAPEYAGPRRGWLGCWWRR